MLVLASVISCVASRSISSLCYIATPHDFVTSMQKIEIGLLFYFDCGLEKKLCNP